MNPETIGNLLEVAGTAGVLWVACFWLVRTIKDQYEKRIAALERSAALCEEDRKELHRRHEELLLRLVRDAAEED